MLVSAGCASVPPPLTPQEVYDQCMSKPITIPQEWPDWKKAIKKDFEHLRKVNCEIRRDRVARGVDPDAEYSGYVPEPSSDILQIENEARRSRQERFNRCLSGAVLPFHCSY